MTRLRWPVAFLAALTLTGGMFWFLRVMIGAEVDITSLKPTARIEFTRLRRDTAVESRREDKARLDMPSHTPLAPVAANLGGGRGSGNVVSVEAPRTGGSDMKVGVGKLNLPGGGSDRDVIPLIRIEPEYPMRAAERGIEGWVLLRFTITPIGTVKDVFVVDAEPKRIFDDVAIKAVSRWKYNPKIEEGVAVERRGVQVVLRFTLDKQQ